MLNPPTQDESILRLQENVPRVICTPSDTGEAMNNPGMGWVFHHFDNGLKKYGAPLPSTETLKFFPGLTVAYLRLPWCHIQPERGVFNWSVVDSAMQRWISAGLKVSFRFTCCETAEVDSATPSWVRALGAKGVYFKNGVGVDNTSHQWEPDYNDPIFLEELNLFLAKAAKRYDGHPNIAFIDVGSFGIWGEGHTHGSSKIPYDAETVIRHLEVYKKHFRTTLLVANDSFAEHGRGPKSLDHAAAKGFTMRTDSILVMPDDSLYHPELTDNFWHDRPIILESEHYGTSTRKGIWGNGDGYLQAVKDYRASYVSIHWFAPEFFENNQELIRKINMVLGYRIQLEYVSWPESIKRNEHGYAHLKWRNAGVAPFLIGGYAAISLIDSNGGIAGVYVDDQTNLKNAHPSSPYGETPQQIEHKIPIVANSFLNPGRYSVCISIGDSIGVPQIKLPLLNALPGLRYKLGSIDIG